MIVIALQIEQSVEADCSLSCYDADDECVWMAISHWVFTADDERKYLGCWHRRLLEPLLQPVRVIAEVKFRAL